MTRPSKKRPHHARQSDSELNSSKSTQRQSKTEPRPPVRPHQLRIIGGRFRGQVIQYSGDPRTRPMKDDVRESVFNLVGGYLPGKVVIDLFAGTGAVGLEGISRGAHSAILIERHFPTASLIESNAQTLDPELPVTVVRSDTFFWCRQFFKDPGQWPSLPWAVFCCPPYALYQERGTELLGLIQQFQQVAPNESLMMVESDATWDANQLPQSEKWRTRQYPPAQISVWR